MKQNKQNKIFYPVGKEQETQELRFLKPGNAEKTEVMRGKQNNYIKFQKILSIKNLIAISPIRRKRPYIIIKIVEMKDFYWPDAKGIGNIEVRIFFLKKGNKLS
jgi:hypothetical protein